MTRPVYTVDLFPRENVHVEPSLARDVWGIVKGGTLLFLLFCIAVLVLTGCTDQGEMVLLKNRVALLESQVQGLLTVVESHTKNAELVTQTLDAQTKNMGTVIEILRERQP